MRKLERVLAGEIEHVLVWVTREGRGFPFCAGVHRGDDLVLPFTPIADTIWSHANAIEYIDEDDAYLVGFRKLDSIFKIHAATGERVWSFGQTRSGVRTR